jgi:hypothetical protein
MRKILYPVILFFVSIPLWAQTSTPIVTSKPFAPKITTIFHKLGDDYIRIRVYQYGDIPEPFFISLHDNEATAVDGARRLLERSGGMLLKIENNRQRNIRFKMSGRTYTCDPNRIFSRVGIIQTLSMFGRIDSRAIDEVDKFAARVLQLLPESPNCIISLHNNSNGQYAVTSYMPGNERAKDAKAVHSVRNQDPDDIFFTTDSLLFTGLSGENYNTILQDNVNAKKDGSLSIYCGEKNIPYLNCETQHGKLTQYAEMINVAITYILKPRSEEPVAEKKIIPAESKKASFVYQYKLLPDTSFNGLKQGDKIFFGEKEVGLVKEANEDRTTGTIEMKKDFPLYNNMDFYIFSKIAGKPKIELRIDPTRPRKLHDAEEATVMMKVMP